MEQCEGSSSSSSSSSSCSSDGNFSLFHKRWQYIVSPTGYLRIAGYGSVVWPDSLSEWLVEGTGPQQMF